MAFRQALKAKPSVRVSRYAVAPSRLTRSVRTSSAQNAPQCHVQREDSARQAEGVSTYRFDNLLSSKRGPNSAALSGLFFDTLTPPTGGCGVVAYGAGLIKNVGVDAAGVPVYRQYHTDAQGSVLAITDVNGNLVTNYQIDAWGNVLSGGSPGNAFDYVGGLGYWADPDLGMHYVRARWMNPQTGGWLSVDPHLDEFAYQYSNNMPTTGTDASGMDVVGDATEYALRVAANSRWLPEAVRDAARAKLRQWEHDHTQPVHQPSRGGAPPVSTPTPQKQPQPTPPPPKSAAPPVGPNTGPSHTTAPPNLHRMVGQGASQPRHPDPRVQGSALTPDRMSQVDAIRAQGRRDTVIAALQGAVYGYAEGQTAVGDAFSFGLGSRLGLVPKEFQNDPIYQTAYGLGTVGRDTAITVATMGAGSAVVGGGGLLARVGITKAPTILGATVRIAPAVHRAASLYNTGLGIYGLGSVGYHAATHQLTGWDVPNAAFGTLGALHLGGALRTGGVGGLFDAVGIRDLNGVIGSASPHTIIEGDSLVGNYSWAKFQVDLSTKLPVLSKAKSSAGGVRLFRNLPGRSGVQLPHGVVVTDNDLWAFTRGFKREFGTAQDASGNSYLFSGTRRFIIRDVPGDWTIGPHTHPSGSLRASARDIESAVIRAFGPKAINQWEFTVVADPGGINNATGRVLRGTYGVQSAIPSRSVPGHFEIEVFRKWHSGWQYADIGATRQGIDVFIDPPVATLKWHDILGP